MRYYYSYSEDENSLQNVIVDFKDLDYVTLNSYTSSGVSSRSFINYSSSVVDSCLVRKMDKFDLRHHTDKFISLNCLHPYRSVGFFIRIINHIKYNDIDSTIEYIKNNKGFILEYFKEFKAFYAAIKEYLLINLDAYLNELRDHLINVRSTVVYKDGFSFETNVFSIPYTNHGPITRNATSTTRYRPESRRNKPTEEYYQYFAFDSCLFKQIDRGIYPLILTTIKKTDVDKFKEDSIIGFNLNFEYVNIYVDYEFFTGTFHKSLVINFLKKLRQYYPQADIVLFDGKEFANKYMYRKTLKLEKSISKNKEIYKKLAKEVLEKYYSNITGMTLNSDIEPKDFNKEFQDLLNELRLQYQKEDDDKPVESVATVLSETTAISEDELREFLSAAEESLEPVPDVDYEENGEDDDNNEHNVEDTPREDTLLRINPTSDIGILRQIENVNQVSNNPITNDDIRSAISDILTPSAPRPIDSSYSGINRFVSQQEVENVIANFQEALFQESLPVTVVETAGELPAPIINNTTEVASENTTTEINGIVWEQATTPRGPFDDLFNITPNNGE